MTLDHDSLKLRMLKLKLRADVRCGQMIWIGFRCAGFTHFAPKRTRSPIAPSCVWNTRAHARIVQYAGWLQDPQCVGVLYLATANSHTPLEAPKKYLDMFPEDWYLDRRQYAAMCAFWDEVLGNLTNALKQSGMWENTLFVFSSLLELVWKFV